jgi:hypothetical protein
MIPHRFTLALLILLMGVLLITGCLDQVHILAGSAPTQVRVQPTDRPVITETRVLITMILETQTGTPASLNEEPWIKIDPVGDKHKGDRINFTSTTNLVPGTIIKYGVSETPYSPRRWITIVCNGTAIVTPGVGGINRLFFECDTTEVTPHEYDIIEQTADGSVENYSQFYLLPPVDSSGNLVASRPKNYIAWDHLGLPALIINTSMQPVLPSSDIYRNSSETWPLPSGRIMVYSPEGVVRVFDKNGVQIAAYYDEGSRGGAVPSGAMVSLGKGTNVTTVYYQGERYLTEIYE